LNSRTRRIFYTYEEFDGSRSIAEISAFELRHGRRKFRAYIQKAVDLIFERAKNEDWLRRED